MGCQFPKKYDLQSVDSLQHGMSQILFDGYFVIRQKREDINAVSVA
jgi:hypothetical protein